MQIVYLIIVIGVVLSILRGYESHSQKVKRMDNDPNNTVKSDKWLKTHLE